MPDPTPLPGYHALVAHYERCLAAHGDTCRGVDWPNLEDARTRYRVMMEVIRAGRRGRPSLLDFGCGASHLYEHLRATSQHETVDYAGLDLSARFVELSRTKFPGLPYFHVDLLQHPDAVPAFDYVVANGVFTEKCQLPHDEMERYFVALLRQLFAHARIGLAFNVMSAHADWSRRDLFHVPFDRMAALLIEHATRDFSFRQDYGLYEYTVYAYRRPAESA